MIVVFGFWLVGLVLSLKSVLYDPYESYAPIAVPCPNSSLIRKADDISTYEKKYIEGRNNISQTSLKQLINRVIPGFELEALFSPLNIAIAFSGGGYRAMLTGAGVLSAYDSRSDINSTVRGVLQSANYIAGISGGSWLIMVNTINDFKPMLELKDNQFSEIHNRLLLGVPDFDPGYKGRGSNISKVIKSSIRSLWNATNLILAQDEVNQTKPKKLLEDVFQFYKKLHNNVSYKKMSGCLISFTDYWGQALTKRLFQQYQGRTFSSALDQLSMKEFKQPFPIICAVQRNPLSPKASHIVEINPVEFGSWDKEINAFTKTKYLGSNISNGSLGTCKIGYDDVGFLAATSSSVFNNIFLFVYQYLSRMDLEIRSAIKTILGIFGLSANIIDNGPPEQHSDYAIYSPNPFYHYEQTGSEIANSRNLYLTDGGQSGQNIPFFPFLQPSRNIDVILSFDMSSDIFNYPNASSLRKSSMYYLNLPVHFQIQCRSFSPFPKVPTTKESYQILKGPVFLGCDLTFDYPRTSGLGGNSRWVPPLILYTANREITYASNTSTFKLSYTQAEIDGMFQNAQYLASVDSSRDDFATCLVCAILKRSFDKSRLGFIPEYLEAPEVCQKCYNKYCWHNIKTAKQKKTHLRPVSD